MSSFELSALLTRIFDRVFHQPEPEPPAPAQSIAEIASTNGNFDILVTALDAAGLTETFENPGDFTVFAPTDDAFTELASTTLGIDVEGLSETQIALALVDALGIETLTDVLFYHVKSGASTVEELQAGGTVDTLLDGVTFAVNRDELIDNDPDVEDPEFVEGLTDIRASNGIIQVIDRVLLPIDVDEANAQPTIADVAGGNDAFEALTAALTATGLLGLFEDSEADFTVFAPTDDAFRTLAHDLGLDVSALSDADLAGALVGALGPELVTDVLLYHVKAGGSTVAELQADRFTETALDGARIGFEDNELIDADPQIANPSFIEGLTDIETANGEIQAIDRVLLPIDIAPVQNLRQIGDFDDNILQGGAGHDTQFGRVGDDIMNGGAGNDRMFGNLGDDIMFGDDGNDVMLGGVGSDHLAGGAGNDHLFGNGGRDFFDMTDLEGHDFVRDLRWNDTLILSDDDFEDFHAVQAASEIVGHSLRIHAENGAVTLWGVTHLDEHDVLFA